MTDAQRKAKKEEQEAEEKDRPVEALQKKQDKTNNAAHLSTFQPRQSISNDVTEAKMRQALVDPAVDSEGKVVEESLIESRTVKLEESDKAAKKRKDGEEAEPVPPPKRVSNARARVASAARGLTIDFHARAGASVLHRRSSQTACIDSGR